MNLDDNAALIVIDVQQGFGDAVWGARNNPRAEENIERLLTAWTAAARPIVLVRHDSVSPGSPLGAGTAGNALQPFVAAVPHELLVTKDVNSAFYGDPDLAAWLGERGIRQIVVVGIQTNMCVETTARMGGNLGFDVIVPIDATHTFDLEGPAGIVLRADDLARATAVNLHGGGFARVVETDELVG
ncbi:cysteine hydrolase family protein [Agromyces atrinae]|uniref:Cysteine hydrolase n=1 Tax=Agromyces atrinae TaxID=592376 RepID=A0A4V1R1W4_9MICO|nr:cysteine hydrolase family protein [Agromyces atrinae]NYD68767.1 nicotinamidase-related amidase [Agromyces atrinae]RXZ85066.1 cysteine hydrolase [Agromyces atrinae]RXZ85853.1 cysteine hydrolase [Agromyces atrinae]